MLSQNPNAPVQQKFISLPYKECLSVEQKEFIERLKRLYKADNQAEYLYLQAEVYALQIQLKQARD